MRIDSRNKRNRFYQTVQNVFVNTDPTKEEIIPEVIELIKTYNRCK
jgi:shikimate kinase